MNSDTQALAAFVLFLVFVAVVAWLGGGRKWAFRVLLSVLILFVACVVSVVLYYVWEEHSTRVRNRKLHAGAVAKVAAPKCVPAQGGGNIPNGAVVCPLYVLSDNPTPQQEGEAIAIAQKECEEEESEANPLHDDISRYREQHGIKSEIDPYVGIAQPAKITLSVTMCAAKIRKKYPSAYTDVDDPTLIRKVSAKYPKYCDAPNDNPGREPVIEGIH